MKITSTKAKRSAATITFGGGSRNVCQTNTACISVMVTNAKKKSTSTIMVQSSRRKFGMRPSYFSPWKIATSTLTGGI
jgi:hypothetical protein